jgi:cyclophilin family peptidyl-prolyl cis-trans isomerase
MDIVDTEVPLGRIVIQLRSDVAPRAAENFRMLCTGAAGFGYRKSPIFGGELARRLFGGDFFGTGGGSYSVYGETFPDENLTALHHDGPGVVGMRNYGPNTNGSQFYITFRRLPELDGRSQIVGHVLEGWGVLERLEKTLKSDGTFGADRHDFRVNACGELQDYHSTRRKGGGGDDEDVRALARAVADATREDARAATEAKNKKMAEQGLAMPTDDVDFGGNEQGKNKK